MNPEFIAEYEAHHCTFFFILPVLTLLDPYAFIAPRSETVSSYVLPLRSDVSTTPIQNSK
jgi:hypothetical protein